MQRRTTEWFHEHCNLYNSGVTWREGYLPCWGHTASRVQWGNYIPEKRWWGIVDKISVFYHWRVQRNHEIGDGGHKFSIPFPWYTHTIPPHTNHFHFFRLPTPHLLRLTSFVELLISLQNMKWWDAYCGISMWWRWMAMFVLRFTQIHCPIPAV